MEIDLNLIPPQKKEEVKKNNQIIVATKAGFFLIVISFVFLFILLSFKYILNLNLSMYSNIGQENLDKYKKVEEYDARFKEANNQISDIITIKKEQLYWSKIFIKLSEIVFPGIELQSFSNENYSVNIFGISNSREDLILFKEKLEKEDCFDEINLPFSNLIGKNDIEFRISFKIKSDCLKNK